MSETVDFERYGIEALARRRGTKWSRDGGELLAAWIADMDFPVAAPIREALIEAIRNDDLGYAHESLARDARELFASRMRERFALSVEIDRVRMTTDVLQAVSLCLLTLTHEGDGVLFLTPSYPPYFPLVASSNRRAVTVDLAPGPTRDDLDLDAVAQAIRRERPTCLLLCNPHNPTGRVFSYDELKGLGELALEHGLVIVSDEIHADLVYAPARHVAIGAISPELAARTVTLSSASKAFNIAGLRCGFAAFGAPELLEAFDALPMRSRGEVNVLGMLAAATAWRFGEPWLTEVREYLAVNRDLVAARIGSISGVRARVPEATYLAWLDFREAGLDEDPAVHLARTARVALSPGPDFGPAGVGFARLNFATTRSILEEILERIVSVF